MNENSKKKSAKSAKSVKSSIIRSIEVKSLLEQIVGMGIPADNEGLQQFIAVAKDFETKAISSSGQIKLEGFKRVINYRFSNQNHITSSATLVFNDRV